MRKILFTCCFFLFCSLQPAKAQFFSGIIWVVPNNPSVLPINNTITGNAELNKIFIDYHVDRYHYLDEVNLGFSSAKSIYEIHLKEEYIHWGHSFVARIEAGGFFEIVCCPYQSYFTQSSSSLYFEYSDASVLPCSPTRSCNDELNVILDKYEVFSYREAFPSSQIQVIEILCPAYHSLNLYYELNALNHLLTGVSINCENCVVFQNSTNSNEPLAIVISPNPVHDYATISGITPQLITIYDSSGRVLFTQNEGTHKVNMNELQQGLYFIHIISDTGEVYVQKLIKQ